MVAGAPGTRRARTPPAVIRAGRSGRLESSARQLVASRRRVRVLADIAADHRRARPSTRPPPISPNRTTRGAASERLDDGDRRVLSATAHRLPADRSRAAADLDRSSKVPERSRFDVVSLRAVAGAPWRTRRPPPAGTTSPERSGEGELVRFPPPDPPVEPNQSVARERARPASGGPPANERVARRGRAPLAAEALRLTESPLIRPRRSLHTTIVEELAVLVGQHHQQGAL